MAIPTLPQNYHIVSATPTITTNGTVTYATINTKNVQMVWIVSQFLQAVGFASVITPKIGATLTTATTAITFAAPWWLCADVSSTDALVAQTASTTPTLSGGSTNMISVIQIDPAAMLAQGSTLSYLAATIATSSQATDFVTAVYICLSRYPQATPPTIVTA